MDNKDKRVLRVELDDEVKKVSITGLGSDEKVVMRQELDEEDLNLVTGGGRKFYNVTEGSACATDLGRVSSGNGSRFEEREEFPFCEVDISSGHIPMPGTLFVCAKDFG